MAEGGVDKEDERITHMYETVLNHNYPKGKWIKAMTTYLVWNIDGDKDYYLIPNDRKGDGDKHAEILFIEKIRGLQLEYMMSKISLMSIYIINIPCSDCTKSVNNSKKGEGTGGQELCITVYINNSPCSDCTKKLIAFLNETKLVRVKFYVTNLYNIRRKSCKKEPHYDKVKEGIHDNNAQGLKDLMLHDRCEIKAFTNDVWKELLDLVTVSQNCKKQLLEDYDKRMKGNERSRKDEDEKIQEDLDHIETNGKEL